MQERINQAASYDSVSGTEGDLEWVKHPMFKGRGHEYGRQYVTFDPCQAYPEFVVTLQRRRAVRGAE